MSLNKKTRNLILLIIIIVISVIAFKYIYQDHRDIKTERPDYNTTAISISTEFSNNISESETKYLNKTIQVSGVISEINNNNLTIGDDVFCRFNNPIDQSIELDSNIEVKGRCIGYDDLLEQLKLDQCSIILK